MRRKGGRGRNGPGLTSRRKQGRLLTRTLFIPVPPGKCENYGAPGCEYAKKPSSTFTQGDSPQ